MGPEPNLGRTGTKFIRGTDFDKTLLSWQPLNFVALSQTCAGPVVSLLADESLSPASRGDVPGIPCSPSTCTRRGRPDDAHAPTSCAQPSSPRPATTSCPRPTRMLPSVGVLPRRLLYRLSRRPPPRGCSSMATQAPSVAPRPASRESTVRLLEFCLVAPCYISVPPPMDRRRAATLLPRRTHGTLPQLCSKREA
jgi:hypothetical protein